MPDAALAATAEALARQILADLPADRPRPRADLARLPAPVARLLSARLDARVDRAAAPPDTPWTDPDDATLRDALRTWREAARAAARFPAAAWEENVERAARLALAHLVYPAETLAGYVFETEDESIAAALALRRIRAFVPYPYLPEIAGRYVDRKGLGRIDQAGLERLLRRIDRRMVSAFSADDWMTLLVPLFDLVGPLASPPGAVPTALLRSLFEAKGADDLAASLGSADALTARDLRQRLAAALPAPASPDRVPSEDDAISTAPQEPEADAPDIPPVALESGAPEPEDEAVNDSEEPRPDSSGSPPERRGRPAPGGRRSIGAGGSRCHARDARARRDLRLRPGP